MKRRATVIPFPRPPRRPAPGPAADTLVEVRRCRGQAEALVVRGLLESEGIPTMLRGRMVQSVHPFAVGDLAEVRVLVHRSDAEHARLVLGRRPPKRTAPRPAPRLSAVHRARHRP